MGRTIRKVMERGGGGVNFRAAGIIFRYRIPYFLRLIGVHEYFSFNFSLREYFFCTSPVPPPPPIRFLMVRPLDLRQPLKFFHSCHMHSLQKHLETNISSITIICSMTYSKHLSQSLLYHRHFFHSSFTPRSPSPEKKIM